MVEGEYQLTLEDSMTFKTFDDVIGISGAWIGMPYKGKKVFIKDRPLWQIPLRSLVPKKTDGLLVAGRCFSFEKALADDTRVIGTCLVTGQGAGVAAGLSIKNGESLRDMNLKNLRRELINQKVYFG
jgi:hypothetical protein